MSEILILHNHQTPSPDNFKVGVSGTSSINVKEFQQKKAQERYSYDQSKENVSLYNPDLTGFGVHFTRVLKSKNLALKQITKCQINRIIQKRRPAYIYRPYKILVPANMDSYPLRKMDIVQC